MKEFQMLISYISSQTHVSYRIIGIITYEICVREKGKQRRGRIPPSSQVG